MYVHATKTPGGFWHKVYLDGKRLGSCIEADEEGGWARYHESEEFMRDDGFPAFRLVTTTEGGLIEIKKFGQVKIIPF